MIQDLRAGYGPVDVVRDVYLEVAEGEVVALLGPNGVGKTTLLKAVTGVLPVRRGHVSIYKQQVEGWPSHRIARRSVAYAPQDAAFFTELSVRENLALALTRGLRLEDAVARAFSLFPELKERQSQKAGTLSGGEQKMLIMGRALLNQPRLLLLDEITEGVQPSIVLRIGKAIEAERARGAAILLVEQKVAFALRLASRYIVMRRGQVAATGPVTAETFAAIEKYMVL
ncbi:MAG TPA: ATP-binding cassette domain-containing protein [Steroidobacteraceae bacterium]|nr:ATP-binding cassette domain-containing protein [Steroidobacteraceae bacterium]